MKLWVGITDKDWYGQLAQMTEVDEVNFWQPRGNKRFRTLQPGEMFLFKLHAPLNFIVGGGFFASSTILPMSMAWEAFGGKNGVVSLEEMRARIGKYRKHVPDRTVDYNIGCILLQQPFFFPREQWIRVPRDWHHNIETGKTYELESVIGLELFIAVQDRLQSQGRPYEPAAVAEQGRYGAPVQVLPRLGQGSFRIIVTDAYNRRCAVTAERTLPVLEAAHIKPFNESGPSTVQNGVLLRSDLHILLDKGYITFSPDYHLEVSRRIKEEYENGHEYTGMHGCGISLPDSRLEWPDPAFIAWHNSNVYLG